MIEFPSKLPEKPEDSARTKKESSEVEPIIIRLENGNVRVELPGGTRINLEGKNIEIVLQKILPSSGGELRIEVNREKVEDLRRQQEKTRKKMEDLSERISGEKRSVSVQKFFELSNFISEIEKLREAANNSSLDEESKKRINELVEKISSTSSSEVIQITQQDLEKIKRIFDILEEIYGLFREIHKIPRKLLDHYKKSDEERFFTSTYFLKIIKTIIEEQFDQTLSLLISGISNALKMRDLRIDTDVFSTYVKPMIAMMAGAMVNKVQGSKQTRDEIRRQFESAKINFENIN